MSIRGGRGPRDSLSLRDSGSSSPTMPPPTPTRRADAYRRAGRYGRGPGDQRRYAGYGGQRGGPTDLVRFVAFLIVLAAAVLLVMATVARPLVRAVVVPWAWDNQGLMQIGFVSDLVREDLGAALTDPASSDPSVVEFTVDPGDTPATLAPRLLEAGVISNERAFLYEARIQNLTPSLTVGRFSLARNLTPSQVVAGLVTNRIVVRTVSVTFREGLRIEQMAAKLETVTGTAVDARQFYDLAMHPTDELLADYPWLLDPSVRPKDASLEGFLYPATYDLRVGDSQATTAEGLIRMMLNAYDQKVGQQLMTVPKSRGLTFYQVLTLASIVEKEAVLDKERPLIAGVYQNRLNPKLWPTGLLQSDPTIFYVNDTLQLDQLPFAQWQSYVFWDVLKDKLPVPLPDALAGYNTYTSKGLPPGPICSPTLLSIQAALAPNTKTGYLFFIAKGDGTGSSAFAKTKAQHDRNVAKYGGN